MRQLARSADGLSPDQRAYLVGGAVLQAMKALGFAFSPPDNAVTRLGWAVLAVARALAREAVCEGSPATGERADRETQAR
jgi:hypothetical protein